MLSYFLYTKIRHLKRNCVLININTDRLRPIRTAKSNRELSLGIWQMAAKWSIKKQNPLTTEIQAEADRAQVQQANISDKKITRMKVDSVIFCIIKMNIGMTKSTYCTCFSNFPLPPGITFFWGQEENINGILDMQALYLYSVKNMDTLDQYKIFKCNFCTNLQVFIWKSMTYGLPSILMDTTSTVAEYVIWILRHAYGQNYQTTFPCACGYTAVTKSRHNHWSSET